MRELTPSGAETFIFLSFSRHIENSLTCSFQQCYRSQCVVHGSAVSVQIAKSDFLSASYQMAKRNLKHKLHKGLKKENAMKRSLFVGMVLFVGLFFAKDIFSATFELTGTWNYTFLNNWAVGDIMCNPGPDASGTCTIDQAGDIFTFAYTSGVVCSPPECCTFEGTIDGAVYTGSTTDTVDNEGGSVTSAIVFTASSATSASGSGTSKYTHPSEIWECRWGSDITLIKSDYGGDCDGAIQIPTSQSAWNYSQVVNPVMQSNPASCKPFAVGDLSTGNLSLHVGLCPFSSGVDVYLAIGFSNELFLIDGSDMLYPASELTVLPQWKTNNTAAINESLYGDIPTSLLPPGTYDLYLLVVPTGETDFSHYYFWYTSFSIGN